MYSRFVKYFGYMDKGYKGKTYDIFAYNGGLFKPDEIMDNVKIDDDILERNIYGVDINEESVEIAKLSLWLRTAQKGRKLNTLNSESWNFYSVEESKLLNKLMKYKNLKDQFGKSYRGIVTGFNEAFIINKPIKQQLEKEHISSKELIKPFLEGKDLSKWHSSEIEKYIIFSKRGITIDDYPAIKNYLSSFKEKLTPRNSPEQKIGRKSGAYKWFEIQDSVDYYKVFESSKINWPNLQSGNKFSIERKGYYINAPAVVLPSDNKMLLCILNSKITWFFLQSICVVRSGGYIEVKPQYFEQIPIPKFKNEDFFEQKADEIINYT